MNTDNRKIFRIVTGITVVMLIVAAALSFLRSDGNATSAELAALSQAMPSQAARALGGDDASFDALEASVRQVASLRRGGAPGRRPTRRARTSSEPAGRRRHGR